MMDTDPAVPYGIDKGACETRKLGSQFSSSSCANAERSNSEIRIEKGDAPALQGADKHQVSVSS